METSVIFLNSGATNGSNEVFKYDNNSSTTCVKKRSSNPSPVPINVLKNIRRLSDEFDDNGNPLFLFENDTDAESFIGMPSLGEVNSEIELRRLQVVANFWEVQKNRQLKYSTVEMALYLWARVLQKYKNIPDGNPENQLTCKTFAASAAAAFRLALKFEERLDVMIELPKSPWDLLTQFNEWPIDKSSEILSQSEFQNLQFMECLETPLATNLFDHFFAIGGWPEQFVAECSLLGQYLLALSQFGSGSFHIRESISPAKIALAAVVLSIKVINNEKQSQGQSCGYEYFPERLAVYTGFDFQTDVQPIVRSLSNLLRQKPLQASVLDDIFAPWSYHSWR